MMPCIGVEIPPPQQWHLMVERTEGKKNQAEWMMTAESFICIWKSVMRDHSKMYLVP